MTKTCSRCGLVKDESDFYVIRPKDRRPRLQGHCKECQNGPRKEKVPLPPAEGKTCRYCRIYKPFSEFHIHKRCLYGYDAVCKACRMQKYRLFAEKYPERVRSTDLKARYGITLEVWEQMYEAQEGKCRICGT